MQTSVKELQRIKMRQLDLFGNNDPEDLQESTPVDHPAGPYRRFTPEDPMPFGRYQGKPIKDVPYDYLLDLYVWNRTGDLLEYIEGVIDQCNGKYQNLTHHKPAEWSN